MREFVILLALVGAIGVAFGVAWWLDRLEDRLEQRADSRPDWKRRQADSVDGFLLFLEKVRFYLDARNRDQRDWGGRYRVH
jgi:hypothetical protein